MAFLSGYIEVKKMAQVRRVSFPLMLSSLSSSLMLLCDRLFLGQYSLGAFNSVVTIGAIILMLQIGMNVCASAVDVFVGRLNGADEKLRLSSPTWQMIWFSTFSFIFFIPLAWFFANFGLEKLGDRQDELFYGALLIAFCPLSPIYVALSSFFVGRKQTVLPFTSVVVGNIINALLNFLLIFGSEDLGIPRLGMKGAALATLLAQCVSLGVLVIAFFSKHNRITFRTHEAKFEGSLLLKILQLGYPNAIAQAAIAAAWSCFFILMNKLGEESITLASFMQTLTGFFAFIVQGLSRGIVVLSANFIGAGKGFLIIDTLFSGVKLSLILSLVIFLIFAVYPSGMLSLFFNSDDLKKAIIYFDTLKFALMWGWLAFLCKSIRSLLSGVLTSSGQTKFVMWNEVFSIWLCFVLPIWFCSKVLSFDVSWAYFIAFLYNLISIAIYSSKLSRTNWIKEPALI